MIQTGLIASKDEILPSKRKRSTKKSRNTDSDNEEEFVNIENADMADRPNKNIPKKSKKSITSTKSINLEALRMKLANFDENLQPVLQWLEQSLNDAAEDLEDEDPSDDPDDCVPLVPFTAVQRSAFDSPDFQELLKDLGFQPPASEVETYWRIPQDLNAFEIRLRARIVAGDEVRDDLVENAKQSADISDAESEDYDFDRAKLNRINTLVYNHSDDDEDSNHNKSSTISTLKKIGGKPKGKINIFDMVKAKEPDSYDGDQTNESLMAEDSDSDAEQSNINLTKKRSKRAVIESDEDDIEYKSPSAFNGGDSSGEITASLVMEEESPKKIIKRIRSLGSEELDADELEAEEIVITHQVKRKRAAVISDDDD